MRYMAMKPSKDAVKKAIDDTVKKNGKLYELLAKYNEGLYVIE